VLDKSAIKMTLSSSSDKYLGSALGKRKYEIDDDEEGEIRERSPVRCQRSPHKGWRHQPQGQFPQNNLRL